MKIIATDLEFPEGPVAMPDGSVIFVEMAGQRLSRAWPDGRKETVAHLKGGPNGAAMGPGNKIYIANNGGHQWIQKNHPPMATGFLPEGYKSGWIEAVDLDTGKSEVLYDRCGEHMLRGPNDIIVDANGDLWFTDMGRMQPRVMDRGGVYWAKADGSEIREVIFALHMPNGLAISADGKTLYVTETLTSRVWSWEILGPGEVRKLETTPHGGRFVWGSAEFQRFDGMAITSSGKLLVGTLNKGGITEIAPDGFGSRYHFIPDVDVSNLCFTGERLDKLFLTLSHQGALAMIEWYEPGLPLPFHQRIAL